MPRKIYRLEHKSLETVRNLGPYTNCRLLSVDRRTLIRMKIILYIIEKENDAHRAFKIERNTNIAGTLGEGGLSYVKLYIFSLLLMFVNFHPTYPSAKQQITPTVNCRSIYSMYICIYICIFIYRQYV